MLPLNNSVKEAGQVLILCFIKEIALDLLVLVLAPFTSDMTYDVPGQRSDALSIRIWF